LNRISALDITYFHSDLTNKISPSGLAAPNPSLINLPGVSMREGVEFALRSRLGPNLTSTLAYTYLDAQDSTDTQEIRRPRHAGRVDLAYSFAGGRGSANLGVIYNGSMTDTAFQNGPPFGSQTVVLDSYWLVNAAVSYKLEQGVEVFGRVENALDARYQEVFGYDAAPITAFAGIKLTIGGPDGIGQPWRK
jgi:vitamin B12 transporter